MLEQLKGIDVGFLSSIAKMISSCRYMYIIKHVYTSEVK